MAEKEPKVDDVPEFDPTATKKKKKKKKVTIAVAEEAGQPTEGGADDKPAENTDDIEIDLTKKKKKKKKKEGTPAPVEEVAPESDDEELSPLDAGLKKKKKKKKGSRVPAPGDENKPSETSAALTGDALPWAGTDRDYTYQEMLQRVTLILREKNPELSGEKKRFLMKPPQVMREGTKKTVFLNFAEICKIMRRNEEHVYQFMLAELGTSGSIDGNQRMIIKGRFQPKAIENILRRYVVEYLTCHSCKSPDTVLNKDNRLFFLLCNQCGAQRSVAAIKSGYVAQVGKRRNQT